ncbi:NADPH-dependent assimilatory sulfite reductase hemoprotein subunit [Marinifilum sp. N1E240]|uniref:NADPH-dependent assimilatory sulfite reductase hemoprotein subunit n=1 Tax=Marinifilum sp. N1E240 TaxID=2608082 RepID=UPI00128CA5A6|nr:NADPH-dependent assimilatory sulfite reductase hemoprotein subunit [Marinifilum sp. N1E240]MPQ46091.1 NADPH-dependent assimilatory sulfite reductase hemoprotein subunit [Marinifilum sp. N1E240]
MTDKNINWAELSEIEKIKTDSNYLRGTLEESLANSVTDAIALDDRQVSKFHGIYQQFDRDTERERKKQKLEPDYSFLIRVRVPGGLVNADQWLQMDRISDEYANGTLKLTTRQAFQFHGVLKGNLKPSIQSINQSLLDTIAACGDVNRNVMASPHPYSSNVFNQVQEYANKVSDHLTPRTPAYYEIWLDKKKVAEGSAGEVEPLYGPVYLPRKFKIGFTIPPFNDTDVFTQDIGFIAIENNGVLEGFNIVVGGGMGTTFGDAETYPRLGTVLGFAKAENTVDVAEKIVLVQKEQGNRKVRKNARLKYTIDRLGIDKFKDLLHEKLGYELEEERTYTLIRNGDKFGWHQTVNKEWYLGLFIEGGRVKDEENIKLKTALREIAELKISDFRLSGNQNLILGKIKESDKSKVNQILKKYGLFPQAISGTRANSIACVALNTCSLAFAEAERYLPNLIDKIENGLSEFGLYKDEIVIRMTGCANGCGRPYVAEIGFIGKGPGRYNLYLGGNFNGTRLNNLYRENVNEDEILTELRPLLKDYSETREDGETFGDFIIRKKYVDEIVKGQDFKH